MVEMVVRWSSSAGDEHGARMNDAMVAVLDGFIRRKVPVSLEAVRAIAPGSAHDVPEAIAGAGAGFADAGGEAAPLLLDWYRTSLAAAAFVVYPETEEGRRLTWMGHVAGMMLAKEPPAGFAALVLEEFCGACGVRCGG